VNQVAGQLFLFHWFVWLLCSRLRRVFQLFLGVAVKCFVANGAHYMNLFALAVYCTAHGFAIYRQTFIGSTVLLAPVSQCLIQSIRFYSNQRVANNVFTGRMITFLIIVALEAGAGILAERLRLPCERRGSWMDLNKGG
jgi:hypothetical protein